MLFRSYRPAIIDAFQKVLAGYNECFLVGKNLDFYRHFLVITIKIASFLEILIVLEGVRSIYKTS